MFKGRKETTHEGLGERKIYINIKKEISTMYIYKWSQDLMYKNNVSKKKWKEKIHNILTTSLKNVSTLPLTKWSYTNSPLKMDYSHTKTTPPFCHKWQRVRVSSRHLIGRASISISIICVRTYVFHLFRTYVMILCNWLILWQNALYLYLGRFRMF